MTFFCGGLVSWCVGELLDASGMIPAVIAAARSQQTAQSTHGFHSKLAVSPERESPPTCTVNVPGSTRQPGRSTS